MNSNFAQSLILQIYEFQFCPMPKSKPITILISKCPQGYTLSSHHKFYFPEVDISSTITLEIMSIQNSSKTL
jgi:hypothetical protein